MRYALIIGDIHEDVERANQILAKFADAERVILVGDYWDSYAWDDCPDQWRLMCDWVNEKVRDPRFTLLWGNHDVQYVCPNSYLRCGGYQSERHQIIQERINHTVWHQFKFLHYERIAGVPWLFSHAGLNPRFINPYAELNEAYFNDLNDHLTVKMFAGIVDPALAIGKARGGKAEVGGVIWQDFNHEFEPIAGLNQIFGHTNCPYVTTFDQGQNICVDCGLDGVAIIDLDTGKARIHNMKGTHE